ncbi:hypothetical protein DdX_10956 [Ditylenchus destructor]|uniref:Uncharacterized protein n=1 Tax=Ditylenchus destructor TaxID=166010 RepID=A0AAD4R4Y5_9BILA|nr:hypothetical protein DdX_10956 [Ditylenchus destructor]
MHRLGSEPQRDVPNFYGVVELDHYVSESIKLALQLQKNLDTVKFLSGNYFTGIEQHISRINGIRVSLESYSVFVQQQKSRTPHIVESSEICSEEAVKPTNDSDISVSEVHQMLKKHTGSEMALSIESVQCSRQTVQYRANRQFRGIKPNKEHLSRDSRPTAVAHQAELVPLKQAFVEDIVHLRLKSSEPEVRRVSPQKTEHVHESASCTKYRAEFIDMRYHNYSSSSS